MNGLIFDDSKVVCMFECVNWIIGIQHLCIVPVEQFLVNYRPLVLVVKV